MQHLNDMLAQIDARLTLERVAGQLPVVEQLLEENRRYNALLHRLAVVVGRCPIMFDEAQAVQAGLDPNVHAEELTGALAAITELAVRYQ